MDIEMPTLDGLEATWQIKAVFPKVQIIIVTNYDDAELRQTADEVGVTAYVLKNNLFDLRHLLSASHHAS
jgi:DNA-binding NarL/FixJ family response regulator